MNRRGFLACAGTALLGMAQPAEQASPATPPVTLFLCGDVMTGRGIDQILPQPSAPHLHEPYVRSALEYVRLAERASGPIARPVDFAYVWGDALDEFERVRPDARVVNLETAVTTSGANGKSLPKRIFSTPTDWMAIR